MGLALGVGIEDKGGDSDNTLVWQGLGCAVSLSPDGKPVRSEPL